VFSCKVYYSNLPGGTEENDEETLVMMPVSGPRCVPRTSLMGGTVHSAVSSLNVMQ
jgi:hypothetical protein